MLERGSKRAKPRDAPNLKRQEGDELGQGDDASCRPARIKQCLHIGGSRIARPKHQQMGVLQRRSELRPKDALMVRGTAIDQAWFVFNRKWPGGKGAIRAGGFSPTDFGLQGCDEFRARNISKLVEIKGGHVRLRSEEH